MVKSASTLSRLRRPPPLVPSSGERFKGVRRRSWGRWVSEIRIPHSRDKIWLGSYSSAEQAARAYDIASLLLRGPSCAAYLNFSDTTSLISADHRLSALVATGIASPRTIQATAAAAANAATNAVQETACDNVEGYSQNQAEEDTDESSESLCKYDQRGENRRGAQAMLLNAATPESCWIEDVLSLIITPKDKSSPSTAAIPSLQLSPASIAKCSTSPPTIAMPMYSSCSSYGVQLGAKATSPEYLLHMLLDDLQHPLEAGLASDGFTAISAAVTTRKRFDTETCEVDGTQLWSYVC